MKFSVSEPGVVVSAAAHAALLLATLVAFSDAPKFQEAQESVPVEVITNEQFNQIMRGEKTAKETKPLPPRADKVADVTETRPTPVTREAKVDTAAPTQEGKREPEPGRDDKPVPTPPKVAAEPPVPPKPEPVKEPPRPEPPKAQEKAEVKKPEPPKEAEAIEPLKAQKPKDEPKKTVEAPTPPRIPPRPRETPPEPPKLDQVAKLLEQKKADDKPAAKPKSGDEQAMKAKTDPTEISRLLSREQAQQRASTGQAVNRQASLGTATANAPKLSPSLWAALDGLMQEQYKQCWSYLGMSSGHRYIPQIKVEYTKDGALVGQPALLNPPSDPSLTSLAESAVRAVRRCNPLKIPAQYQPYFEQWRARILRFDPEEMQG
ncbi:MAG: TolA protein [Hyphomicrobiales bacterium]|nr:TolA protein [Hyphomicrobiales bacterium]